MFKTKSRIREFSSKSRKVALVCICYHPERSYVTPLIGSTNKRVDKRFTFVSLSHPKFVHKLKVALLFFSSNSC